MKHENDPPDGRDPDPNVGNESPGQAHESFQLTAIYVGVQTTARLAESEADWDRLAEQVDRLWSLSEKLVPLGQDDQARVDSVDPGTFDARVVERARHLADDARISTFDRLGQNSWAVAIIERRLLRHG